MIDNIIKRNGTAAPFDARKISNAIYKANISVSGESMTEKHIEFLTNVVTSAAEPLGRPTVEHVLIARLETRYRILWKKR